MPNNSFKPKLLRYTNGMAGKACHAIGSTTQFGLTQALGGGGTVQLALRQAKEEDRELFWQLLVQSMRPYVDATWGWDDAYQRDRFARAFDPAACQVIELDGAAVGGLQVDYDTTPIRLLTIQIFPPFQRRGLGTAIITGMLQQVAGRPVWLQVLKVNPAKALYERLGFRVTRETETHWHLVHGPAA